MQVVSFGLAALYSGMWCLRWARGGGWEGAWGQLGLFSSTLCVGSVVGAVAWGANIQNNAFQYEAQVRFDIIPQQGYALFATSLRFASVFVILYGFEFLCLVMCKLMLLGRLATSAGQSSPTDVPEMSGVRRRWLTVSGRALPNVYRVMAGAVVVGSVVGMVADAVAGAYGVQQAGLMYQAAGACDAAGNDTNSSLAFFNAANVISTKASTAQSVQSSSEALTLLIVSVAFLAIVSWSSALFRMLERFSARVLLQFTLNDRGNIPAHEANVARIVADAMQAAAEHQRRLTAACVIVLVTFPARVAFDLLNAYADFNDPFNNDCSQCEPCQSTRILINTWLIYTPEFQPIVVAVSSPLPLTLSLWLLTKFVARARLIAADVERAHVGDGV